MKKHLSALEAKAKAMVSRIEEWEDTLPTAGKIAFRIGMTVLGLGLVATAFWLRRDVEPKETLFIRLLLGFPLITLGWPLVGLVVYLSWPKAPTTSIASRLKGAITAQARRLTNWLKDTSPASMQSKEKALGILVITMGIGLVRLSWLLLPETLLLASPAAFFGLCAIAFGSMFLLPPAARPI